MSGKTITQFLPLAALPVEECERHYVEVHFPFAQAALRELPNVLTYHTNRTDRQLDIAGGWYQRPTAWRFVLLQFVEGTQVGFTPEQVRTVELDHENCLRRLQRCAVREEIVVDRRCGQRQMTKYLVAVDRRRHPSPSADVDVAAELDGLVDALTRAVDDGFGGRLLIVNRVIDEAESAPGKEEGQRVTKRLLPSTDKVAIVEMYFDDATWGDAAIVALHREGVFRSGTVDVGVFQVHERCGLDRRQP